MTLSDGKAVKLDQAAFARAPRAAQPRGSRKGDVGILRRARRIQPDLRHDDERSRCRRSLFFAKARKYPSTLEAALDGPNIPVSVYTRLIDGVNKQPPDVPSLPQAAQADDGSRSAALLRSVRAAGRIGRSWTTRLKRRRSMCWPRSRRSGADYQAVIQRAFNERWIDLFPNEGKRSGAYSNGGAYDVHPYMLLNYNGQYDDVSTLAHELGPHDAELLLEQDAAVSAGRTTRSSSPRWRRRSTSRCSSTTC